MKKLIRLLCILTLALAMLLMAEATALGADTSNLAFNVSESTVSAGDIFTVTISADDMTVQTFTGGIRFDKNKLECVSIVGARTDYPDSIGLTESSGLWTELIHSNTVDANKFGTVGFAIVRGRDSAFKAGVLAKATFKALKSGSAKFTLYEDTTGISAFKSDDAGNETLTVTGTLPGGTGGGAITTDPVKEDHTPEVIEPTQPENTESLNQAKTDRMIAGIQATTLKLSLKRVSKGITIKWTKSKGYKVDGYQVYRSMKRNSGYGKKAFYVTKSGMKTTYTNTKSLVKGKTYYFKVRGVRKLEGKTYFTKWSNKVYAAK